MTNIIESAKGFITRTKWDLKKKSPEILLVCGIVTTVAGVIAACGATIKAQPIIEEHKKQVETIKKCEEAGKTVDAEGKEVEYTHKDAKKDTYISLLKTGVKCGKVYLLACILIGLSIFCQIKGYKILAERLAAASAAYAALAAKFKAYRKKVADKFGPEEDKAIYCDMKAKEIETVKVDADGNEIKDKLTVMVTDDDDYTALFTEYNPDGIKNTNWWNDAERNLGWLKGEQAYLNHKLQCLKGRPITLNEVRERLGLNPTAKGGVVGWTYEPDNPNHHGDNFIDFGLEPIYRAYRNGEEMPGESSFLLEFNVDGDILYAYNKYKEKKAS